MLENFKAYLIEQGYSTITPSGNPSTVYDYMRRVEKIRERENITLKELSENISFYVEKYGPTGKESEFGKRSHNSFINGLKRFEDFLNTM